MSPRSGFSFPYRQIHLVRNRPSAPGPQRVSNPHTQSVGPGERLGMSQHKASLWGKTRVVTLDSPEYRVLTEKHMPGTSANHRPGIAQTTGQTV